MQDGLQIPNQITRVESDDVAKDRPRLFTCEGILRSNPVNVAKDASKTDFCPQSKKK
jgi:hypothetical protein